MDKTTDFPYWAVISAVRYVDFNEENKISSCVLREDFLQFTAVHNTTGKNLAGVMLESLQALRVDCTYLVGHSMMVLLQ